jgi:hypothetical protein
MMETTEDFVHVVMEDFPFGEFNPQNMLIG